MSTQNTKTKSTAPAGLEAAAAELAASVAEQAAGMARAAATEADTAARAYELLMEDQAAGNEPKGWAEYLEKAEKLKS